MKKVRKGNTVLKTFVILLAFLILIFLAGEMILLILSSKEGVRVSRREQDEEEVAEFQEIEPDEDGKEILSVITVLNSNNPGSGPNKSGTGRKDPSREEPGMSDEYVIEASDKRLLTYSDIAGLSARELNYAKNEIYARHGRKFQSGELQDFFNSKSWYIGMYEPGEFDSGRSNYVLSEIEKKNIDFLREAEEGKQSGGYKLTY